jgi:hypothetical protein
MVRKQEEEEEMELKNCGLRKEARIFKKRRKGKKKHQSRELVLPPTEPSIAPLIPNIIGEA